MLKIGRFNKLKVYQRLSDGFRLNTDQPEPVILPFSDAPEACKVKDEINVFVYPRNQGNYYATIQQPRAEVDQVAWLKCIALTRTGAFMDWGISKDLLLPFSEQNQKVVKGQYYLVRVFLDEDNRIVASMYLDDFIQEYAIYLKTGQQVDLIISDETDLGRKAIINHQFWGILYKNEIFQPLHKGQKITGYIKKIRDDRKIDLILQQQDYTDQIKSISQKIIAKLNAQGGMISLNDKSPPDDIYQAFGVSKKVFKRAIGRLYKQRIIAIEPQGIYLLPNTPDE